MIVIQSKREGFRRLGIAHSRTPVSWPDDRFSFDELEQLKADPNLTVSYRPDPDENLGEDGEFREYLEAKTVAELKEELKKIGEACGKSIAYPPNIKKASLVELIISVTGTPPEEAA